VLESLKVARVVPLALAFERFGLSAFFLYLALGEAVQVRGHLAALQGGGAEGHLLEVARHLLIFLLDVLVGLLLLLGRRPLVPPQQWRDLVVPLFANFFYLGYNVTARLPAALTANLWPETWRPALAQAALGLGLVGFSLSLWAAAYLGRSFAVLVAVKPVVTGGPYRFVRHPIYLSYGFHAAALVCAYGSIAFAVLVAGHVALLLYRARLEEDLLVRSSAEYRAYRERTPFLLPGTVRSR